MADDAQQLNARLAKEAYTRQADRAPEINGYYLQDYGDDENAVYRNAETGNVVQALRGTQLKGGVLTALGDLRNDVGVALPFLSSPSGLDARTDRADKVYRVIASRYGPPTLTGHSLGGTVAQRLLTRHPESRAVTFNPGSGILPTLSALRCRLPGRFKPAFCNRSTNFRTRGDVASLTSRFGNFGSTTTRPDSGFGRHSIDNFT